MLVGTGLLAGSHFRAWRAGRIDVLESMVQGSAEKISFAPAGTRELRFSISGDPAVESFFHTRYVSAELSEKKRENLEQRLQKAPEIVVFQVLRDSKCGQCEAEIEQNDLLTLEAEKPLCGGGAFQPGAEAV